MYGCESWTIKKAESQRIDAFEFWCWRRLLRVPWDTRRSNQSLQFSHSVVSNSLQPNESQHAMLPYPSSSPRVCSNSRPLSRWCHPTSSSCRPLLLLPSILPSIRAFSHEPALLIRWPKCWTFSFSVILPNNIQGWLPLGYPTVQGALKHLLQHHSSKASVLQHSDFFIVQLSHPYMTNGKTIALTRRTFVGKVMSLLFNILSKLVITFLPRSVF